MEKHEKNLEQSKVQTIMHLNEGKEGDYKDPKNNLLSIHKENMMKTLWYNKVIEEMNLEETSSFKTYRSHIYPYDALHSCYLTCKINGIKVKNEEYEVTWTKDLFINMIKSYHINFNGKTIPQGTTEFLNFELKSSKEWKRISDEIGNKQKGWSSNLEPMEISIPIPYSFSRNHNSSFPLRYCGSKDSLSFSFSFSLKITDFLLMRKNKEIIDIDLSVLDFGDSPEFELPRMKGVYTLRTKKEKNNSEREKRSKSVINYLLIVPEIHRGDRITCNNNINITNIKLEDENKYPVESIYWGCLNQTLQNKVKSHLYCRKNTSSIIEKTSITPIFENLSSYESEKVIPLLSFENTPTENGYNMYKHSVNKTERPNVYTPGLILDEGNISMSLHRDDDSVYQPFVILNKQRFLTFVSYPQTDEERKGMSCTVEF